MTTPDPDAILEAVSYGVLGQHITAMQTLQPFVDAGPASTYGMLCVLAHLARPEGGDSPTDTITIHVERHGRPASIDELPPRLRFATRFVAATANRDHQTACALFTVLANHSDSNRTPDLAEAITVVYDMAVATAAAKAESWLTHGL